MPNQILLENALPGTTDWKLTAPATQREIEGYASLTSINRGGSAEIDFFVSTHAVEQYTYEIFRMGWYGGAGSRRLFGPITLQGFQQQEPPMDPHFGTYDCDWEVSFNLDGTTTVDWVSGIYLVKLIGLTSGKQSYIIFVLHDDSSTSDYVFQSSVTTYQAYNNWPGPPDGKSLYCPDGSEPTRCGALKVSFNRPYSITNLGSAYALGLSFNPNAAPGIGAGEFLTNLSSDRFTTAGGWEWNLLRFLEREGYDVSYITSLDTHEQGSAGLQRHRAFLSVGHDEYWSWEMRDAVEGARDRGVNLGFFSSNTAYWQARFEPSGNSRQEPNRIMVTYKDDVIPQRVDYITAERDLFLPATRRTHLWGSIGRPEEALVGVSHFQTPVAGADAFYSADLVVFDASSWVFEGIDVSNGTTLRGLVGMEADSLQAGSPPGISLIAHSPIGTAVPTDMITYTTGAGSTVFATGSMQWSWGLDDYDASGTRPSFINEMAQQITRNVLSRLASTDNYSDSFDTYGTITKLFDPSKWVIDAVAEGPGATEVLVEQAVHALIVTPASNTSGLKFNGYRSATKWNLAGKRVTVEAKQITTGETADTFLAISVDHNNWYRIIAQGGVIYFQRNEEAVRTMLSIPYSPTAHRWWRIGHDTKSSCLIYEVSTDGRAWTYVYSLPAPTWIKSAYVEVQAGTWESTPAPGAAQFCNLFVEPAVPRADPIGFAEDFSEFAQDRSRWVTSTISGGVSPGAACISQGGGELEIRMPARSKRPWHADPTSFLDEPNYTGYVSKEFWSFVNMMLTVEVAQTPNEAYAGTFVGIGIDVGNWCRFVKQGQFLYFEQAADGAWTTVDVPYDSNQHRWWRLKHIPGSVVFETSPDNSSWTTEQTFIQPWWLENVKIELQAGTYVSGPVGQAAKFRFFSFKHEN